MNEPPLIALLTDFGITDPYVGVMKAVIAQRCPAAHTIDITHAVGPQNIRQAAYLLRSAYRYFPAHTVFLAVVDPGVGTARHPVAIQTAHGVLVGPNNGLFSAVLEDLGTPISADGTALEPVNAVILPTPEDASATFHGRDVFAPAAASLACGQDLNTLGMPVSRVNRVAWQKMTLVAPDRLAGDVLHVDHFGNIVTSLGPFEWIEANASLQLRVEGKLLRFLPNKITINLNAQRLVTVSDIKTTYGATQPGGVLALINSDGQLEIAVNQGSAMQRLNTYIGAPVACRFGEFGP